MIRFAFVWRSPLFKPYFGYELGHCLCMGAGPFRLSVHWGRWHQ